MTLDGDAALRTMPDAPDSFAAQVLRKAGIDTAPAPADSLIQYFGPTRTYPTVSYYQALDPDAFLPPDKFKDRDRAGRVDPQSFGNSRTADPLMPFPTPYTLTSESLTAGVEVQATILDNLLHRLYVVPVPRAAQLADRDRRRRAGGLPVPARSHAWKTGFGAFLLLAALLAGSWLLLRFGRIWAPPVLPVSAALLVVGAASASIMRVNDG